MDNFSARAHAFGAFRLLPAQRLLMESDRPLRLGSRALEILVALVEGAGKTVKKSELIARVWPGIVVEEATLRVHIAAIRKVLGDGRAGMRYVENVTGQGYRFIAPVTQVEDESPSPAVSATIEAALNMPGPLTRVIGRAPVVATLATRLLHRHFVTLVGPGGIGKTTVALAAADRLRSSYRDGVRFIDLASVTDPLLAPAALASALGLAGASQGAASRLLDFLKSRQTLLVLDNCEHVIDAAAFLAETLLAGAANLHILATSREPLRANAEWVLRLPPLEIPAPSACLTAKEALSFSAVELFNERAMASLDGFELGDPDVPVVAEICRQLDGLPLAIELAAARVEVFGLQGLAARLDDRLNLLTVGRRTALPRHRTLRATLDWSYDTLSPVEQTALRRLAVFTGSFNITAARRVIGDADIDVAAVTEVLCSLAAKSLITVDTATEQVSYQLLDTSRAYALEKLESSDESRDQAPAHPLI
jgi:predicted ATPase/DNA-binding winged helix-turn-helix (wHTH) protein